MIQQYSSKSNDVVNIIKMCILLSKSCGHFLLSIDVNYIRPLIETPVIRSGTNVHYEIKDPLYINQS